MWKKSTLSDTEMYILDKSEDSKHTDEIGAIAKYLENPNYIYDICVKEYDSDLYLEKDGNKCDWSSEILYY